MSRVRKFPPGHVEVGHRYSRLVVLGAGSKKTHFKVACDCGVAKEVAKDKLRSGHTTSCGCYRVEVAKAHNTTHGVTDHPLFGTWAEMRNRCSNSKNKNYGDYGGRGITVCARWDDFSLFVADLGERPTGHSLDRINTNGDYEPANCRWSSRQDQVDNRRNSLRYRLGDELYTLGELAEVAALRGISYYALSNRLKLGVDPALATTLPVGSPLEKHLDRPWTVNLYAHA